MSGKRGIIKRLRQYGSCLTDFSHTSAQCWRCLFSSMGDKHEFSVVKEEGEVVAREHREKWMNKKGESSSICLYPRSSHQLMG